jgi:hypothetical protein
MSILFGTNNYAYIPPNSLINSLTNALTVCSWCQVTASGSLQMIINRQTGTTPANEWWSLNLSGQAPRALIGDATSVTGVQAAVPTALALNTWYHLAMTYDGTNILLYKDGVLIGSGTRTLTFGADTSGVVIGANAQSAGDTNIQEFFLGNLEDLRVYSRVLSANELVTIMNSAGRDAIFNNILFHLRMNELSAGTATGANSIKDDSINSLHATPYGSCVYAPEYRTLTRQPIAI